MSAYGDPESLFNELYKEHGRAVHAYFYGRTSDREGALDLMQETFTRAWRNIQLLQQLPQRRRGFWLFTVARNLLTDHYRSSASLTSAQETLASQARATTETPDQLELAIAREESRSLEAAIDALPEGQRTIITLNALAGLTSSQIAELVDKPAGTVRYQLLLARRSLAQGLERTRH